MQRLSSSEAQDGWPLFTRISIIIIGFTYIRYILTVSITVTYYLYTVGLQIKLINSFNANCMGVVSLDSIIRSRLVFKHLHVYQRYADIRNVSLGLLLYLNLCIITYYQELIK